MYANLTCQSYLNVFGAFDMNLNRLHYCYLETCESVTPLFQEIWFLEEVLYFDDPRVKLTQSNIGKACNHFQPDEGLKII